MLNSFKRVITSGKYMGEIDGLRFIAIISVILFHITVDLNKKNILVYPDSKNDYKLLFHLLLNGDRGVPLFFSISGFILALPFANHYILGKKKVNLREYFLRRVTRLEPPYILSLIILFFGSVYVVKKISALQLFPSFIASIFYLNNLFDNEGNFPVVNAVAWSLEIEIQFYILAPLLALVYKFPTLFRRTLMFLIIILLPILQFFVKLPVKSLYNYLQYFVVGLLLADLFTTHNNIKFSKVNSILVGSILFVTIWAIPGSQNSLNILSLNQLLLQLSLPAIIFGFFYLVLFSEFWNKMLNIKLLSIIGGMCYSIYLFHFAIISLVDRFTVNHKFTGLYIFDLAIQFVFISIMIILMCSVFFLLVEKPCMQKDWPKKMVFNLKNMKNRLIN